MKSKFKVGDKVKIIGNSNHHCFKLWEIVEISRKVCDIDNYELFVCNENRDDGNVRSYDMELLEEHEHEPIIIYQKGSKVVALDK